MDFTLLDAVDILIVAYVIYKLMNGIRGTRATTLIKGLAIVFVASLVAQALGLQTVSWLLERSTTVILVSLPVVFYPELRRALEEIGRGQFFGRLGHLGKAELNDAVDQIVDTALALSARKVGALIILEREIGLQEYIETGTQIDGHLTGELLSNIFEPNSPLHDGAVIVRQNRITAAGCFLPLTDRALNSNLGTRHRAAVGLSEQTDAVVVVVSEETGAISIAIQGNLRRYLGENRLRQYLLQLWQKKPEQPFRFRRDQV